MPRGRCARCRKIANRDAPDYFCPKCKRWAVPGVGPTPLAPEIAEPYRLQDPGLLVETEPDPRKLEEIILDALDAPGIRESMDFVAAHRNHDCEHYDGCLNIALFQHWHFFSCAGCAFFGKK